MAGIAEAGQLGGGHMIPGFLTRRQRAHWRHWSITTGGRSKWNLFNFPINDKTKLFKKKKCYATWFEAATAACAAATAAAAPPLPLQDSGSGRDTAAHCVLIGEWHLDAYLLPLSFRLLSWIFLSSCAVLSRSNLSLVSCRFMRSISLSLSTSLLLSTVISLFCVWL